MSETKAEGITKGAKTEKTKEKALERIQLKK
jgi:hypothetical protein